MPISARSCHKDDGQGEPNKSPRLGYSIPPLWGDDSFNAAAGMAKLAHAAAYIRTNMPFGVRYQDPVLSRAAGLGCRGLHDLQAAAASPAWSRSRDLR